MDAHDETIVRTLLDRHGRSFAAELGVDPTQNTPAPLFRLLCFALLASTRIGSKIAMRAAHALADQGWTSAEKMAASTWRERTDTLNQSGYARYDESTSRMLGDTAALLLEEYGGDLRRLRERSARDPAAERRLLKQCKGVGDVGASIFFREVQAAWDEWYPYADKLALRAAERLGLGADAQALARLVPREDYTRLIAALVRCDLAGDYQAIQEASSA
ncbi:MAG: hypothetical protein WD382_07720 [Halofilum sp. (in: g-proteobacteria)]